MTETMLAVTNIVLTAIVLALVLYVVHQSKRLRRIAKAADDLAAVGAATLTQILRMSGTAAEHSADLASDMQAAHDRADAVESSDHGAAADAASRSGEANDTD